MRIIKMIDCFYVSGPPARVHYKAINNTLTQKEGNKKMIGRVLAAYNANMVNYADLKKKNVLIPKTSKTPNIFNTENIYRVFNVITIPGKECFFVENRKTGTRKKVKQIFIIAE